MIDRGLKAIISKSNANEVKSGMLKAGKWMTEYIKSKAISVDGDLEKIRKVATISATNDSEVGDLIVKCMEKVGEDGIITAELSSDLDTTIDITTGMKLDRGWSNPNFVTSPESGKCEMDNPYVAVIGEKISSVPQILPLIQDIMKEGRPFLIVCDDMDEVVNSTLVINTLQGAIRCCVVKGIDFGDGRKNILQDIATACGGTYVCTENGVSLNDMGLEHLGEAKKVIVSKDNTIIFEGGGDPEKIKSRVEILKTRLNDPSTSQYDKTKFSKRIANLCGGIAIIKAGGATEVEKINRKNTIEDSILASKSALSEGCCSGSGYTFLKGSLDVKKDKDFWKTLEGDEVVGANVVFESLPIILETVATNALGDEKKAGVVLSEVMKSKKENWGYNAKTKKYCDLVEEGVLDSAKALRVALENAISTASMILLIDCIIIPEPEEKNDENIY